MLDINDFYLFSNLRTGQHSNCFHYSDYIAAR